ncbi:right-handed parallel beta-helix repeat-containing protein [Nonomuraea roseoviolacea]|uniref:right-handed parallel beta-helix repeat-containing protein n=1 Tax=Nonomuraea roseoviolacea TaxID=103837 RepID=UPI0031CF81E2
MRTVEDPFMIEIFVAPGGDDSGPGTRERPFATPGRARDAARAAAGEVLVQFRGGTYPLAGPLELTAADSGRDGHRIVYQSFGYGTPGQEEVVLSGGRGVTVREESGGVWTAVVGGLEPRQLHVAGRRAERASIDALPGAAAMTETGYTTDSPGPLGWRSPGDVEFVHRGVYPWTEARCGVAAVAAEDGTTVVTMAQPAFGRALDLYNSTWQGMTTRGPGLPTRIENDATFLTRPGTFVVERPVPGAHILRYLPRPGERPEDVVVPALETLLRITGARDVSLRGLTFADATWTRPSGPEGFLHYHGSGFYEGGPIFTVSLGEGVGSVSVPAESVTIPACVVLDDVSGVTVEGCRFTRLGATGLGVSGGADVTVRGCDFDTLSAGALTVTRGARDVLVEDNWIHHVGLDYPGSPGVAVQGTTRCTVSRNHVAETPHCGIVAGPGRGTRILGNVTTGTMSVLADGGGVYLSGPQGESHEDGAVIRGNVITDTRTPYNFGLYCDYGAAWVTVEDNVVARADTTAILHVSPPLEHVVYRGNVWDADPMGADAPPPGVTYEGNTTLTDEAELLAATEAVRSRAGLLTPRPGLPAEPPAL